MVFIKAGPSQYAEFCNQHLYVHITNQINKDLFSLAVKTFQWRTKNQKSRLMGIFLTKVLYRILLSIFANFYNCFTVSVKNTLRFFCRLGVITPKIIPNNQKTPLVLILKKSSWRFWVCLCKIFLGFFSAKWVIIPHFKEYTIG